MDGAYLRPSTASIGTRIYQDTHLRRDLNHADSHNTRLSPARSGAVAPFHWTRSLSRGPSISMTHSAAAVGDGTSSINVAAPEHADAGPAYRRLARPPVA